MGLQIEVERFVKKERLFVIEQLEVVEPTIKEELIEVPVQAVVFI